MNRYTRTPNDRGTDPTKRIGFRPTQQSGPFEIPWRAWVGPVLLARLGRWQGRGFELFRDRELRYYSVSALGYSLGYSLPQRAAR